MSIRSTLEVTTIAAAVLALSSVTVAGVVALCNVADALLR